MNSPDLLIYKPAASRPTPKRMQLMGANLVKSSVGMARCVWNSQFPFVHFLCIPYVVFGSVQIPIFHPKSLLSFHILFTSPVICYENLSDCPIYQALFMVKPAGDSEHPETRGISQALRSPERFDANQ